MKQYLLMKLGDFVISVSEGDNRSKDKEWLLVFFFLLSREWILNDNRTFDKEGYVGEGVGDGGEHYLVENERGSGLTVSLKRVASLG